jgi:hypothetical protein
MKFDDPDRRFPAFRLYVWDFGRLTTHRPIVSGLMKWGKMTEAQVRAYLAPGHNPAIVIVDSSRYSVTKAFANFPYSVDLNAVAVLAYESTMGKGGQAQFVTGSGLRVARVGVSMLGALIVGHLRVFSPDDDDHVSSTALIRVQAFEDEVYGHIDVPPGTTW